MLRNDLKNKRFGKLLVVKKLDSNNKSGYLYWECVCDCGAVVNVRTDMLTKRGKICCGCSTRKYSIGDKIGKLTIIDFLGSRKNGRLQSNYWLCECMCGNKKEVSTFLLSSGSTKSCGCLRREFDRIKYNSIVGELRPWFFNNIKRGAESRNLDFDVTPDYLWKLWEKQDGKCALSGLEINLPQKYREHVDSTASLDRIDSSKGYIDGNVQWLHKHINVMKNSHSQEDFIKWCSLVYKFSKEGNL